MEYKPTMSFNIKLTEQMSRDLHTIKEKFGGKISNSRVFHHLLASFLLKNDEILQEIDKKTERIKELEFKIKSMDSRKLELKRKADKLNDSIRDINMVRSFRKQIIKELGNDISKSDIDDMIYNFLVSGLEAYRESSDNISGEIWGDEIDFGNDLYVDHW
jgi:chromosome segregation ATPase